MPHLASVVDPKEGEEVVANSVPEASSCEAAGGKNLLGMGSRYVRLLFKLLARVQRIRDVGGSAIRSFGLSGSFVSASVWAFRKPIFGTGQGFRKP